MTVNKVILVGNLGADVELAQTAKGTPVCTLSLATSEKRQDSEHTEWHKVVVFSKQAENCAKYLKKGSQVCIEGKIATRKWQDKDGKDRYSTEILADNVKFLRGGSED